jgi:hypothetical protein
MTIISLRSPESQEAGSPDLDFPLPVADPFVRPMHRECVLKGCAYRSRFLFAAGWALAALSLLAAVAIGIQGARSQVNAQREQRAIQSAPPVVSEKEPAEASAPPPPPKAAAPRPRKSAPQRDATGTSLPPVPESEKWWNRP